VRCGQLARLDASQEESGAVWFVDAGGASGSAGSDAAAVPARTFGELQARETIKAARKQAQCKAQG